MRPLSDEIYSHIDAEVLRFAAERGTEVHFATELYDLYGAVDVSEKNKPYLDAYINWKKDYQVEVIEVEQKYYHKQLLYAGTVDRIIKIKGIRILLDLKTTRELNSGLVSVQCSAYREMLATNDIQVDQIATLKLNDDGTYVYQQLPDNFKIFLALYQIEMFKRKIKG
jgi:hypothetical protein